jgi:hypothetical protein
VLWRTIIRRWSVQILVVCSTWGEGRGLLDVSMMTRFPVIGSRIVMCGPPPFRQSASALQWVLVSVDLHYSEETLTGLCADTREATRWYIRPRLLGGEC